MADTCDLTRVFDFQLLKDMVAVSEATSWAVRTSVEAKYRALRCHIAPLSTNSAEYNKVKSLLDSSTNRWVKRCSFKCEIQLHITGVVSELW